MASQLEIDLIRLSKLILIATDSIKRHLETDGRKGSLVYEDIQTVVDKFRAINKRASFFYFQEINVERCHERLFKIGEIMRILSSVIMELLHENNKNLHKAFNLNLQVLMNDMYWVVGLFTVIMDCSVSEVESFHQLVGFFKDIRDAVQKMELRNEMRGHGNMKISSD